MKRRALKEFLDIVEKYDNGTTLKILAEELGVSKGRASQIVDAGRSIKTRMSHCDFCSTLAEVAPDNFWRITTALMGKQHDGPSLACSGGTILSRSLGIGPKGVKCIALALEKLGAIKSAEEWLEGRE